MTRVTPRLTRSVVILSTVLSALACSGAAGPGPGLDAAIVPDADLLGRMDFQAVKQSAAYKSLQEQEPEGEAEEGAKAALELVKKLKEATGLSDDDIVGFLMSADTDSMDWNAKGEDEAKEIERFAFVLAVALNKPLSIEKLQAGIEAAVKEGPQPEFASATFAGAPGLIIKDPKKKKAIHVTTAQDEKTLYFALNTASIEGAVQRERDNKPTQVSAAMASVEKALAESSQARLLFVVPDVLRGKIKEFLDKGAEDPMAAMAEGFIKPFQNIQSVAIGAYYAEGVDINLAADLGDEQAAVQAATVLQTMVLPMLKGGMAKALEKTPAEVADKIVVSSEGQALRITVKATVEDLTKAASQGS